MGRGFPLLGGPSFAPPLGASCAGRRPDAGGPGRRQPCRDAPVEKSVDQVELGGDARKPPLAVEHPDDVVPLGHHVPDQLFHRRLLPGHQLVRPATFPPP